MLQSKWGNYGKFNGEKLETGTLYKKITKNYSFEIDRMNYNGYNQVLYSGYLSILETEDLVQMDISIYLQAKLFTIQKSNNFQFIELININLWRLRNEHLFVFYA